MPLTTLLWKQKIQRLMQEYRKWYLRPYFIKRLVHFFFTYDEIFTPFFLNISETKRIYNFQKWCKMCVWTHLWMFHQKFKFAKNVTYNRIALSWRYVCNIYSVCYFISCMSWCHINFVEFPENAYRFDALVICRFHLMLTLFYTYQ